MNFQPIFSKRDFSGMGVPPPVSWTVERYRWSVFGGPKEAVLHAQGDDLDLWNLVDLLRCPVEIYAPQGDATWWGYVAEVQGVARNVLVRGAPRVQFGVTIDSMRNRIAVAYSLLNAAGEELRATTDWEDAAANDLVSQAEYGTWELLMTASAASQAHAEAARAMKLAQVRYPVPALSLNYDAQESGVTIVCRGWWDTLDWQYCAVPLQLALAYTTIGDLDYPLGDVEVEAVAQLIELAAETNLATIWIYVRKVGAPVDNLEVSLCAPNDLVTPGATLASGTLAGASVGTDYAWLEVPFSATYDAAAGPYFIQIGRSGGFDASNYYELRLDDDAGYTRGAFNVLIGEGWDPGPDADMPFEIYADEAVETSQQLYSLARNYGQFLRQVAAPAASGITVESFRDGDSTALYEMLLLLQMGTTNNRRLLAEVDRTRRLRIFEEPALDAFPHLLYSDGSLADASGVPLRKALCPVGMWARWTDVIPPSVNTSRLGDPALIFIDEMEYEVATDRLIPAARGVVDPFDFAKVNDG